jgi:hypothetical protein
MSAISTPSRKYVLFLPALCALFLLAGCGTSNPICGSSRPKPLIASLSPSTIDFAQVQQGKSVLTVNGSQFVASSVIVINEQTLSTTVVSGQQLQVPLTTSLISGPGTYNVLVQTPGGNSGDIGCASGGSSSTLVLTVN